VAARKATDLTPLTAPTVNTLVSAVDLTEALPANQNKKLTLSDLTKGLSAATTGAAGVVQLSTSTSSTSTTLAATANAVKTTYDLANGKATLTLNTAQASTSGTVVQFTGLPAGIKRITIAFAGVSTSSTSLVIVQLGDAGGFEASGYAGGSDLWQSATNAALYGGSGFALQRAGAGTYIRHGLATLVHVGSNQWVFSFTGANSEAAAMSMSAGSKTLSDVLTQVRVTTVNGTDTFNAGNINILYEI
jgi:hypothetical protein